MLTKMRELTKKQEITQKLGKNVFHTKKFLLPHKEISVNLRCVEIEKC